MFLSLLSFGALIAARTLALPHSPTLDSRISAEKRWSGYEDWSGDGDWPGHQRGHEGWTGHGGGYQDWPKHQGPPAHRGGYQPPPAHRGPPKHQGPPGHQGPPKHQEPPESTGPPAEPPDQPPYAPPYGPPLPPYFGLGDFGITVNSPEYTLFSEPLFIPPVAEPIYVHDMNGKKIQYYEVTIEAFEKQIYPNLGPAHLIGYNGSEPGPTFKMRRGVEAIVRVLNRGDNEAVVHLHGSPTHSPWDGWASDFVQPGQYKDYYYPNIQAGPLWYHDHADGLTTPNIYYGQAGVYLIHDPAEDVYNLPEGNYDIPLTIVDKIYQSNGDLVSPADQLINFYGDVIQVNGQPWPYLNVEPRKYRFRLFDFSASRPYDLSFVDESGCAIEVLVIASDAGLLAYPVPTTDVVISMGERYEVVIDFAPYKGSKITLMNIFHNEVIPDFANTDKVMQFVVGDTISDDTGNGEVPSKLKQVSWPPQKDDIDHIFNFQHGGDDIWTINGEAFDDMRNRVLARPQQGTVENWKVIYASGPGVHPVHVHLVNFQIVSRTGGSRGVLPYEAAGLKDSVLLEPGETAVIRAVYGPWNGLYMWHCHNLVHEDHMMMDAFNVTLLEEIGYDFSSTINLTDPMDPRFTARDYSPLDYQPAAIQSAISSLGALNAYAPGPALATALSTYYSAVGYPTTSPTETALTISWPTMWPTAGAPTGMAGPYQTAPPTPTIPGW